MASKKLSDYYILCDNTKNDTKIEKKFDIENVETKEVTKEPQLTDKELNGTVEVRIGNETYRTWKVEFIRPYII